MPSGDTHDSPECKMEGRLGGESSPKKTLNLVAGFYHYLRDEQEAVQKRTFTKWINSHLAKHVPALEVKDLFEDIKDGVMLLALLEVLSGQKLPCEQGKKLKRIHWVANIGTALKFLEGRKSAYRGSPIKLVNINSTDIVDGRPSIVLGLVWTIILYFQIEELTSSLPELPLLSSSTSSMDSSTSSTDTTSPPVKRRPPPPVQGGARKALLRWVQQTSTKCLGLDVKDFGPSWRTGLAFFAVINALRPNLVDMERARRRPNRENLQEAFLLAETELGVPQLLDPEDVDVDKPDEKSVMTYVAQFLKYHPQRKQKDAQGQQEEEEHDLAPRDIEEMLEREQRKTLRELKMWLDQLERDALQTQETGGSLAQQYQLFKSLHVQLEVRRKQVEAALQSTQRDGMLTVDQALVKQAWERASNVLLDWHLHLDRSLPAPLDTVGVWLHEAEGALRDETVVQQADDVTAKTVHRALEQHKDVLRSLESHQQIFQRIHKDRSVDGIPVPPDQLQDMAERLNFVSTSSSAHLARMEFLENKHHMQAFLMIAESKLKSWIVKYGRQESVELMLHNYICFVEKQRFFENYEMLFRSLKESAEAYVSADSSVDDGELGVRRFMREVVTQWRSLSMEVRSVRSMLEQVLFNWEQYASTVTSLQAWLEDAEEALSQPENTKREFFRNLAHWIDQHAAMNDAGNFLIETCDETVSLDLKQQLLLMNGRWRELFLNVKQYAHLEELEKWRKDHLKAVWALKELLDSAEAKLNAPVQVSFLSVRSFLQDVENTKQKVVAMETQYKLAARSAQLLAKDAPQDEATRVMATMATAKSQLSKVRERCPSLVKECHGLLPLLEEMEKHMSTFYQALERATLTTSAQGDAGSQKLKWQDLLNQQQNCKRCLSVIERNHHTLQRLISNSKGLKNFDQSLLQKRVLEIQSSAQTLLKEVGEWRRQEEANTCLRRRFEESRHELERVLKKAHDCFRETGEPEELLKKHTDFFGQLDQRVLSVFLKACDELTDILPQEEQQGLQETVRKLHKHWKDLQAEVPSHLLRLNVQVERKRVTTILQDCRSELQREQQALSGTCSSERLIQEHRTFFREHKPLMLCEKRIKNMEELCHKLPDNDQAYGMLESTKREVLEVSEQIKSTYLKLEEHPDKWKEWNERFCELSDWLSSQRRQLRLLKETARNSCHQEEITAAIEALQQAVDAREESLVWLKGRLAGLSEVSSEVEVQRQRDALTKLSTDLRAFLSSLRQLNEEGSTMFQFEELRDEIDAAREELLSQRKEAEEQISRILNAENFEEAKQLYLIHQKHLKRLHTNRREAELLVSHCRQLQSCEELSQPLRELERAFSEGDQQSAIQESKLQATLSSWQNFDMEREAVWTFISSCSNELHKELIFNNLDSLRSEMERNKELFTEFEDYYARVDVLFEKAAEIQLGSENQDLPLQQAHSTREALTQLQNNFKENGLRLERMCGQWESFSRESEALSLFISENEKELEALCTSTDPLEKQITTLGTIREHLEEQQSVLARTEADCGALSSFVTPGEAGRIRSQLVQTRRCFDELKERTEQLGSQLNQSASYRQRCKENLEQVKKTMKDLKEKLDFPIRCCSSSSDTYKVLQEHIEVCQSAEQLKPGLAALSSALKRLAESSQLEEEVADLQRQQRLLVGKAAEKQSALESLLALWQRYEKENSSIKSWLDRCESVCCPDTQLLSANKVKLKCELQSVQEMQEELMSYEALLEGLENLKLCLHPAAPEAQIQELNDDLAQFKERCTSVKNCISHRNELLELHLQQLELFDQTLLSMTQKSENLLSGLRSSCRVDVSDIGGAMNKLREHEAHLQEFEVLRDTLNQRESSVLCFCTPEAKQQLQDWKKDCLQPLAESQRLISIRKDCLTSLKSFLEKCEVTSQTVSRLREAVEGRGSWDHSKAEDLLHGIKEVAKDVGQLEGDAVTLDGKLSKAHMQMCGSPLKDSEELQGRTSCREKAVALTAALEEVQRGVGWRQTEADALGDLWCSFRKRKEEVMKNLKKLENDARQEGCIECSVPAFQNRLRFFVQLEDELQSLQHSQRWLEEKGNQLARRDSELAGEALREVTLVRTAWENLKKLITNSQEQTGVIVDLLRLLLHLKSILSSFVEKAHAVVHNLPDHNHDVQEARSTLTRHEVLQAELREKQEEMDHLISVVEDLQREVEKVPNSDMSCIQKEMEHLRDQWLLISEKIQTNAERLGYCVVLWDDLKAMEKDINQWTATSIPEMSDIVCLSEEEKAEAHLVTFQAEIEKREQKLDVLQERLTELKERAKLQETPIQMQVLESELRKKMLHAQEVFNQAKHALTYFSFQKQHLEDLVSQMAERLDAVEGSLQDLSKTTSFEDILAVKDLQSVVQQQRADMDLAREALTSLSRSHPSQELAHLSSDLTCIAKRTEAVAQRCTKTKGSLQEGLHLHFKEIVQDFKSWLENLKLELKDCFNQSGDVVVLGAKLQRLKVLEEQSPEGEERLSQIRDEALRLHSHLSKAGAAQVQESCSSSEKEWKNFLDSCSQGQQDLEDSINVLKNFDACVKSVRDWLQQMDLSLKSEPPLAAESQQGAADASEELDRIETLNKDLVLRRESIKSLCQEAQALSESGRGSGGEVRVTGELQMEYQTLLQAAKEKLRGCQENQAFGDTLQGLWTWLEEIQERLGTVDSTMGTKEQLEQRLETVQDILLLKGEGEVKLNMAMGKGELAMRCYGAAGQEVVRSQLQEVEDAWATLLVTAMSCHSRLEWTVSQWGGYIQSAAQLQSWMDAVKREMVAPLTPQPGPREKAAQLDRLRALLADLEDHQMALASLEEKARELFKKTGDASFNYGARTQLQVQFDDLTALVEERIRLAQAVVLEHQDYLEAVRELTDWLMTAGEELQHWSETSGDSAFIKKKLADVQECVECRLLEGRERLSRVRRNAAATAEHTAAGGCEAIDRQLGALSHALEQWEGAALRARDGLEGAFAAASALEEEYSNRTTRLEDELKQFEGSLRGWSQELMKAEGRSNGEEAVEGWQLAKNILEGLQSAEPMAEKLKGQLNDLVRYSRDLGSQSERVTALIKQHNSLSLRASRECQNKERLLEQRFRAALRDFQQWLVNAKISTAKCFDVPQTVTEASSALQKIQEFLSDRENGQARLSTVGACGELLMAVVSKDKVEGIEAKVANARDDWKSLMSNLQMRQDVLKNLQSQMTEFEASADPLQEWLNSTEVRVQESSARLHDLPAKRQELSKLQCVLEEMAGQEVELSRLRERAHHLWEGQAAGKGFVHRVSQLSAQYLSLSNLTKDKASRIERIVGEHRLFSEGLKELQDWVCEAQRVIGACTSSTTDKGVLEDRMLQLEALLAARQEREIQLKMLLTRGEAVQRNTSAEGVPVIRKQIQDLKDSWDSLLSASIQCKSQLEGALSQWTSYQEDVGQFVQWMERVEETLSCSDRQYSEMRDKTANLGKTKLLYEEVLSHSSPLETIATKGSNMAEHYNTQQEVQQLQSKYNMLKDKAKSAVSKAKELVLVHQEYQRGLHVFEDWLEQEQASLALLSYPEGNVEALEKTLQQLQNLQGNCTKGQSLLASVLTSRDRVILWGVPQIEDRALDTAQREWAAHQSRLEDTKAQLRSTLTRLRQMGHKFLSLAQWLEDKEKAVNIRSNRQSDPITKQTQLKKLQGYLEPVLSRQGEVEGLSSLAQQVLQESYMSSRVSVTATQLTSRYHSLLLNIQDTIKQLQEELRSIEEAETLCVSFTEWLSCSQKSFTTLTDRSEPLDRTSMEKKTKKLETKLVLLSRKRRIKERPPAVCERMKKRLCQKPTGTDTPN